MVIIETQKEYSHFLSNWNSQTSIIFPVWVDPFLRPIGNQISFLYVRFINDDYILPLNHNDCLNLEFDINELSKSIQTKIIWDKKSFLQSELSDKITNLVDLQCQVFFTKNELISVDDTIKNLCSFYIRNGSERGLGKIIPIVKWIAALQGLTNSVSFDITDIWIDKKMIPILSEIERMGIPVDVKKFSDRWPNNTHLLNHSETGTRVYTEYNPYTITSRPTNRHSGINWGALNKEDGTREVIRADAGKELFMLDYDAFHLRLIGKLLKIPLPETSIHQMFADQWGIEYNEAKSKTFRILYGGVTEEDRKIPFFKAVDDALLLWGDTWKRRGWIQTAAGRLIYNNWITDWTPIKGFNYLLQATETEFNMQTLSKISDEKLPLPIMYNYDSFMWELDAGDTIMAHKLRKIIESIGIPAKSYWGKTYNDL